MTQGRHIFSVLVENKFGVLARVAGLFSGRGFNIDSLSVSETEDPNTSQMTIVTHGDEAIIEQIEKQLNRLIEVIRIKDITKENHVEREMILVKVAVDTAKRGEVLQIVDIFRARTIDVASESLTIEITGDENKLRAVIDMLRPYGIRELVRTGKVAIMRSTGK
ncbi:acetolactate synthase small subunit [Candidatus Poribacteria bacterium]|nr:acetolactate synthase small subunit [Candidatus Poribacteria bacterium]